MLSNMGRNLSMWYRCMFLIGQSVILQSKQGQHGERGALGGVAGGHVILLLKSGARKSVTIILTKTFDDRVVGSFVWGEDRARATKVRTAGLTIGRRPMRNHSSAQL